MLVGTASLCVPQWKTVAEYLTGLDVSASCHVAIVGCHGYQCYWLLGLAVGQPTAIVHHYLTNDLRVVVSPEFAASYVAMATVTVVFVVVVVAGKTAAIVTAALSFVVAAAVVVVDVVVYVVVDVVAAAMWNYYVKMSLMTYFVTVHEANVTGSTQFETAKMTTQLGKTGTVPMTMSYSVHQW